MSGAWAAIIGGADLALAGHLARKGKGHADPADLIDDLFAQLTAH